MSTYRERREARAERLRDWAEKRETKSAAAFQAAHQRADMIPFGQPILVGHHSEKRHRRDLDRIHGSMDKGVEHARKAESMHSRASNIESQLKGAIYSDDPDAIPALEARLAKLEAERERIKAFNASVRKGKPDESILTEGERRDLATARRFDPFTARKGTFPAYHLTNLSGNITRNRQRLAELRHRAGGPPPARSAEAERRIRETLPPPRPAAHPAIPPTYEQPGLFRRGPSGADLERERRRRVRQAKGQRRRRDGRFR